MKFKIDENLPAELKGCIESLGHSAETVFDEGLTGSPDPAVLARAASEGEVLLTLDKGIANIRVYQPDQFAGIVLFRPPTSGRGATLEFVLRHFPAALELNLCGRLLVITERGFRLR